MPTPAPFGHHRRAIIAIGLVLATLVAACTPGDATPTPMATSADAGQPGNGGSVDAFGVTGDGFPIEPWVSAGGPRSSRMVPALLNGV